MLGGSNKIVTFCPDRHMNGGLGQANSGAGSVTTHGAETLPRWPSKHLNRKAIIDLSALVFLERNKRE